MIITNYKFVYTDDEDAKEGKVFTYFTTLVE